MVALDRHATEAYGSPRISHGRSQMSYN